MSKFGMSDSSVVRSLVPVLCILVAVPIKPDNVTFLYTYILSDVATKLRVKGVGTLPQQNTDRVRNTLYQWLSGRLQCVSSGDIAVSHQAIDIYIVSHAIHLPISRYHAIYRNNSYNANIMWMLI